MTLVILVSLVVMASALPAIARTPFSGHTIYVPGPPQNPTIPMYGFTRNCTAKPYVAGKTCTYKSYPAFYKPPKGCLHKRVPYYLMDGTKLKAYQCKN